MQTWILLSEIARNVGFAVAALGGVALAWRTLTAEPIRAGQAAPQAGLALRAPRIDLHGAFIRHTNSSNAILRDGDLSDADLTGATLRNSDSRGTRLTGTILNGVDLTGATNLTLEQLASAVVDEHTRLPAYIDRETLQAMDAAS